MCTEAFHLDIELYIKRYKKSTIWYTISSNYVSKFSMRVCVKLYNFIIIICELRLKKLIKIFNNINYY